MHATKIDIAEPIREKLIALLNSRLADALDLMVQTKQAHWNVKGPSFIALHELFDDVSEKVEEYVDLIAERITTLGGTTDGTVRDAAKASNLPEYPHNIADGKDHVEAVSTVLAKFGALARKGIDQANKLEDMDTADLFTEVSRGIDKLLWFVEAHNQAAR